MNEEKVFTQGMIFKQRQDVPDFVLGQLSFKVEEFIQFAKENQKNGWLNVDLLKSKAGKPYSCLNKWEPSVTETTGRSVIPTPPAVEIDVDDIPF